MAVGLIAYAPYGNACMQDVYQMKQPASQHRNRVGNTHTDTLARPYYLHPLTSTY